MGTEVHLASPGLRAGAAEGEGVGQEKGRRGPIPRWKRKQHPPPPSTHQQPISSQLPKSRPSLVGRREAGKAPQETPGPGLAPPSGPAPVARASQATEGGASPVGSAAVRAPQAPPRLQQRKIAERWPSRRWGRTPCPWRQSFGRAGAGFGLMAAAVPASCGPRPPPAGRQGRREPLWGAELGPLEGLSRMVGSFLIKAGCPPEPPDTAACAQSRPAVLSPITGAPLPPVLVPALPELRRGPRRLLGGVPASAQLPPRPI